MADLSGEERELALKAKFRMMADEWFEEKSKQLKSEKKEESEKTEKKPSPSSQQSDSGNPQSLLQHLLFGGGR